jgi:hypothetical protein
LDQAEFIMKIAEGIIFRVNAEDGRRPHIFFGGTPFGWRIHPGPGMFIRHDALNSSHLKMASPLANHFPPVMQRSQFT